MTRRRPAIRRVVAVLAVLLAFAVPAAARAAPEAAAAAADAQQGREILVMLRLTPEHFRPNASYGGDYGDQATAAARRRMAREIARRHGLEMVGDGWAMPLVGLDCYLMRVPGDQAIDKVVGVISKDPQVAWSEPMQVFATQGAPASAGDPLLPAQPAATAWKLTELHRIATGRGVTIAVVDSKVDVNHPDLSGQFVADEDFVVGRPTAPERHGTGVAGIIAAKAGNGVGIAGVAPDARLMALRACWQSGGPSLAAPTFCDTLSLAKAIHFAIEHHAGIINLSLTGPPDLLLKQLLGVAIARRISVVAAFDPALPGGGFPASASGVIAVANESLPSFPQGVYGAPGRDVPTTQPGGKWYLVNGSSYAAAHVSGLLALVREQRTSASRVLLVAAQPGGGVVDACATLLKASKDCACSCGSVARLARSAR